MVVAPRPCRMVCLDQGRPVYPQDGFYAGLMVPCGRAEMSLGEGGVMSQLGDDLKWSMFPSTNHNQRTETGQGRGQEVWSKARGQEV